MKEVLIAYLLLTVMTVVIFVILYYHSGSEDMKYLLLIMGGVALIVEFLFLFAIGFYRYYLNEGVVIVEKEIVVAGGCFWGVEEYFKRLKGIIDTKVAYGQGTTENPTYEEVCSGETGYTEVVYLKYNAEVISLKQICDHLFRIIDPLSVNRQGGDEGTNYRTGIYYYDEADKDVIDDFIVGRQKKYYSKIAVEVEKVRNLYDAEDYHQDYLTKNKGGYCHVDFSKMKDSEKKAEYL